LSFVQCVVSQHGFDKVRWILIADKLFFFVKRYFCSENIVLYNNYFGIVYLYMGGGVVLQIFSLLEMEIVL